MRNGYAWAAVVMVGGCTVIAESGGESGASSSSSSTGSMGAECTTREDCPLDTGCASFDCNAGQCTAAFMPNGTQVPGGPQGTECTAYSCPVNTCIEMILEGKVTDNPLPDDCKIEKCDALGGKYTTGDPTETPPQQGDSCKIEVCDANGDVAQQNGNDGAKCADAPNGCFYDSECAAGVCATKPRPAGTPCVDVGGKGKYCNGAGVCAECLIDADCDRALVCKADMCARP